MKDCIVLTRTPLEVKQLHESLGREYENTDYWGRAQQNHHALWVWTIKNGSYSGSSGYRSIEQHMDVDPDLPVMDIRSFLSTPILTP